MVESVDPISGASVRLSISPNGLTGVRSRGAVAVMATADRQTIEADVCSAFCCHVRHFACRDTAVQFALAAPVRHVVELEQLDESAGLLHAEILCASAS